MTQRNETVDRIIDELERHGLKGVVGERGKHLEIAWETPLGRRFVIAPRTPSDWRAGMNLRSDLRKLLKADNIQPKAINDLSFQRAMSLPKLVEPKEHVLQKDVEALVDLVFELQSQVADLSSKLSSIKIVSTIQFGDAPKVEIEQGSPIAAHEEPKSNFSYVRQGPFRQGSKQADICNLLTEQFQHVSVVANHFKDTNIKYIYTTLFKAKKAGFAESGLRGMWRRRP
jgi:hypothetical protein